MDSKSLGKCGFRGWHPWGKLTILDIPLKEKGIYIIRSRTPFPRKVGESDILYIGSSDNLVRRIFGNYLGGVGGKTTQRIHEYLFEKRWLEKTEISWVTSKDFNELEKYLKGIKWTSTTKHEELEKRLKLKFKQEHGELPLWNKQL